MTLSDRLISRIFRTVRAVITLNDELTRCPIIKNIDVAYFTHRYSERGMFHSHWHPLDEGETGNCDDETCSDIEPNNVPLNQMWWQARRQRVAIYHRQLTSACIYHLVAHALCTIAFTDVYALFYSSETVWLPRYSYVVFAVSCLLRTHARWSSRLFHVR